MILNYNFHTQILVRLSYPLSLIFFACIVLSSCHDDKQDEITITWNNNKQATGLAVPKSLLQVNSIDSIKSLLQVRLASARPVPMLGDYSILSDKIIFTPLIPLTRGLTYEILFRNTSVGKIIIPLASADDVPAVTGIYPTQDTLPENLLKLYIEFSSPMREGESMQHITLHDHKNDTIPGVFLDLQPELWNKERTVLTLWLDPGRIKRELKPNLLLGTPLKKGETYTLVISRSWKNVQDLPLLQTYTKRFFVEIRDSISPNPEQWILHLPAQGTRLPLEADLGESLDHFLLQETITLIDESANKINGKWQIGIEEKKYLFVPDLPWQPGHYNLQVASYLEDLAGNNLNRLFDQHISKENNKVEKGIFQRSFVIK